MMPIGCRFVALGMDGGIILKPSSRVEALLLRCFKNSTRHLLDGKNVLLYRDLRTQGQTGGARHRIRS